MNKVIMMGRLTKDVDLKYAGETAVAKYSIAVNRSFKKEGQPDADFFNCVAFGKSADFAEKYFQKGQQVAITGRLQTGNYTNKEGIKVYTTDIIIEEQHFADSKKDGGTPSKTNNSNNQNSNYQNMDDDELPF